MKRIQIKKVSQGSFLSSDKKQDTKATQLSIGRLGQSQKHNLVAIPSFSAGTIQTQKELTPSRSLIAPQSQRTDPIPIQGKFLDLFRSGSAIKKRQEQEKEQEIEHQTQLKYAQNFEHNLGYYLFNHGRAKKAASMAIAKMKEVMGVNQDKSLAGKVFGGKSAKYAGNVGDDVDTVLEAINSGNLREKMTAFYNASLDSFKTLIEDHISEGKLDELRQKGVNDEGIDAIKQRDQQRHSKKARFLSLFNDGIQDIYVAPGDVSLRSKEDPLYQGQSLFRSKQARLDALSSENSAKQKINKDETGKLYGASLRPKKELGNDRFSAELSSREKDLIDDKVISINKDPKSTIRPYRSRFLPWEEGGTRFKANPNNSWIKEAQEKLKMPVVSGPSGTTDRMFQALKYLGNPVDLFDFRLALLGWMLTSNDHSFHEIMSVAKTYGLPYEPGLASYHDIEPLTISELRQNVCLDKEYPNYFPDEIVYWKNKDKYKLTDTWSQHKYDPWQKVKPKNKTELRDLSLFNQTGQDPGFSAMKIYTGGGYLLQNTVMSNYPEWVKKMMIRHHVKNNPELDQIKELYDSNQVNLNELSQEATTHNKMLKTALKDAPLWKGKVYRGEVTLSTKKYNVGNRVTYSKFLSTAKKEDIAKEYLNKETNNRSSLNTPVFLTMDVKYGRDINVISLNKEDEILLPPGSEFVVTKNERKDGILYVTLDQTGARGYEKEHQEHKDFYKQEEREKQQEAEQKKKPKSGNLLSFLISGGRN